MELPDKLYTTEEVAKLVNASKRSIYRYVEEGKLVPETKTAAGTFRFTKEAILKFLYPVAEKEAGPAGSSSAPATRSGNSAIVPTGTVPDRDGPESEYKYFRSSIADLKALAHTIRDKGLSDGKNYAFTLFAGFSLHRESPIKFSTIHIYVEEGDLEYWKGALGLSIAAPALSNICLIMEQLPLHFVSGVGSDEVSTSEGGAKRSENASSEVKMTSSWYQSSYEINGFKVVSDSRLKGDLKAYSDDSRKLAGLL